MRQSNLLKGLLCAILAHFMFVVSDTLIKILSASYPLFMIVLVEGVAGCIAVLALIVLSGKRFPPPINKPLGVLCRSVLAALGAVTTYYAFSRLPLADVYSIIFCAPLIVTAAAVPLLGERVGARRWIAVVVGLAGVLVLINPGFGTFSLAHLAAVFSAFISAGVVLLMRAIATQERRSVFVGSIMLAHVVVGLSGAVFDYRPMTLPDAGLAVLAGLAAATAQYLILEALRRAPAVSVAPMQYTRLLWAMVAGLLLFGDAPQIHVLFGSVTVIASVLYIMNRDRRNIPT